VNALLPRQHRWRLDLVIAGCLFIVAVTLRVYNVDKVLVFGDETYFEAYIFGIIGNNWLWPVRLMQQHPPLFPYLGALSAIFFSGTLSAFRCISSIMGGLAVVVIYLLGREMFDRTTGFIAGILLAFASFFIVVSRYAILDASVTLFIYLSLYAFWKGYFKDNDQKYMVLAGLFLGVANDIKYAGFLLYPTYAIFIIWYRKSLRSLLDKRVLLAFVMSVVAFSPILLALQANNMLLMPYDHLLALRSKGTVSTYKKLSLDATIVRGLDLYVNAITGYPSVETSSLPWFSMLESAIYILAPLVVLYSLAGLFRRKKKEKGAQAFLGILFVVFNGFIVAALPHNETYMTWSLPAFFLMFASFAFLLFRSLRSTRWTATGVSAKVFSALTPLKIVGLLLVAIVIVSTFFAGLAAPAVDKGGYGFDQDTTGFFDSAQFIKKRAAETDILAMDGSAYINFSPSLFGPVYPIMLFNQTAREVSGRTYAVKTINIDFIEEIKPRFLLVYSYSYSQISETDRQAIFEHYRLAFEDGGWRVFERTVPPARPEPVGGSSVAVFVLEDLSLSSVPPTVTMGEPYVIDVWVLNQGNQTDRFRIDVSGKHFYVLKYEDAFTLSPSRVWHLNITVVPRVPDVDSVIRIGLFLETGPLPSDLQLQDTITKPVRIQASFFSEALWILLVIVVAATVLIVGASRIFKKRVRNLPSEAAQQRR